MQFTRTIRRKMMIGLALVLAMLITLSLSGVSGLASYRRLVKNLHFSLYEAPRRSELAEAFALLAESLPRREIPSDEHAGREDPAADSTLTLPQVQQFRSRLEHSIQKVRNYHLRLERLPYAPSINSRRVVTKSILAEVNVRLDRMRRSHVALSDPDTSAKALTSLREELSELHRLVHRLPDHQNGLHGTLDQGRDVYNSRLRLIGWTTGLVVLLFFGLWRYMYRGIFAPLRKLHQGASRVAQGDFDYRLELSTSDEMAELAESFNKMTARFQEIAADLDRQVRERSKQLVRSERLAGIGFLAAGVAHEINNPLSAIAMAAESLHGRLPDAQSHGERAEADVAAKYLEMIQRESFRCQQITERLKHFARGEGTIRHQCDLTLIVREVLSMVQHMSKYADRSIVFERTESCYAEVNGPEIKQVVLNIVANGLDSMDAGGTLQIGLIESTDHVIIAFKDDGCGMTPAVLDNLFEPFFTCQRDGKGTGLGMSISHRIVTDHGGTIEATSEGTGLGSTFRVHLPRRSTGQEAAA